MTKTHGKPFPYVPPALVDALDALIPARSPGLNESERELMWRGGKRAVVDLLRRECAAQQNTSLE